ncbi:AAA family ATPase [Vibrio nitrifigilis]|uniref:DUF3696 domain-containing protein n=1 Tax=Vibrio nitrifigilis TaxID=2789781 RepID=A0ABS0GI42_9VIBR|nr:DUF3696 domain-containing protein [Vibrio nitrifigilis]MBF9002096.1 DUF3696 domain-containing protein [Vibrio nitrifigilis]
MKITSLTIGGFKGIKNKATIPLAPITLFFGANSTGKSTVLHALLYLYEVVAKRNFDAQYSSITGEALYFGGFHNLVHGKQLDGVITLGATLDFRDGASDIWDDYLSDSERFFLENSLMLTPDAETDVFTFEIDIRWDRQKQRAFVSRYECSSHRIKFFQIETKQGMPNSQISHYQPLPHWEVEDEFKIENLFPSGEWKNITIEIQDSLPRIDKRLDLSDSTLQWETKVALPIDSMLFIEAALSQATLAPLKLLAKKLNDLIHIGPLRIVPTRSTVLNKKSNSDRWYDGTAGWETFAFAKMALHDSVNKKFNSPEFFNAGYQFQPVTYGEEPQSEKRVELTEVNTGIKLTPTNVGIGISQVFPFVVATSIDKELLVSCEQPELHIHPKWQLSLADMMLEAVHNNPDRMFFIESHSEHILLRLLKRRRQTADEEISYLPFGCKKQDVQIIFCEQQKGQTKLIPIKTTDEGEFDAPWPNGFFEERGEELF